MGLQKFERRLERLVEGVFAKTFRSGVSGLELARRLAREMDLQRTPGVRGVLAPNGFRVALSESDYEALSGTMETLRRDLSETVREHAREAGYRFAGVVEVTVEPDPSLGNGEMLVASEFREGPGGAPGALVLGDGTRVSIGEEPIVIGRDPDCGIQLSDQQVSRRHAQVARRGDSFVVSDLESTNGTRVNRTRIREQQLADGDRIVVGSTTITFEAS